MVIAVQPAQHHKAAQGLGLKQNKDICPSRRPNMVGAKENVNETTTGSTGSILLDDSIYKRFDINNRSKMARTYNALTTDLLNTVNSKQLCHVMLIASLKAIV